MKFGDKGSWWCCFCSNGLGVLHWIRGLMMQEVYLELLQNVAVPTAMSLREDFIFQQDGDPNHTATPVKYFFSHTPEFGLGLSTLSAVA